MAITDEALMTDALTTTPGLPARLVAGAADVTACEASCFDDTYIEFLDTQVALAARGPAWTERLERRRAALRPFVGVRLIWGRVRTPEADYTVYVDPARRTVVHGEEYSLPSHE